MNNEYSAIAASDLAVPNIWQPPCLQIAPGGIELLRLEPDGTVIASDAVTATEAGKYFAAALVEQWPMSVAGVREQAARAAADERQALIVKWLEENEFGCDETDEASLVIAAAIRNGEHLKGLTDGK